MSTIPPPAPGSSPMQDQQFTSAKDAKAQAKAAKAYRKASRPWFKKKRFWLLGLIALFVIIGIATSGGDDPAADSTTSAGQTAQQPAASNDAAAEDDAAAEEEAPAEEPAMEVTAQEMIADLENNALAAANKYEGKKIIVTGYVDNIDASGDYFSIRGDDEFTFTGVQLYIDDSHLDAVSGFSIGQEVTVTGTVTDVGEILGYSVDVESIN